APIARLAQKHHTALLFFLRSGIFQDDHFAVFYLVLEQQEAAVRVHDHGLASLAELLSIVILPRRLYRHPAEHPRASSRRSECSFGHSSIFKGLPGRVNQEAIWLYRITNSPQGGRLVPLFLRIYHNWQARGAQKALSQIVASAQHSHQ